MIIDETAKDEETLSSSIVENETEELDLEHPCVAFVVKLYNKALKKLTLELKNVNKVNINGFYFPELAPQLLRDSELLTVIFPIMQPIFGYGSVPASSSDNENSFKIIKHDVLGNVKLPMPVQKFIPLHVDYLDGQALLTMAAAQKEALKIPADAEGTLK